MIYLLQVLCKIKFIYLSRDYEKNHLNFMNINVLSEKNKWKTLEKSIETIIFEYFFKIITQLSNKI